MGPSAHWPPNGVERKVKKRRGGIWAKEKIIAGKFPIANKKGKQKSGTGLEGTGPRTKVD